jgi:hypothetical protein
MKDSLWEVDRVYGVGFRDPRDEQLEALFEFDDPQLGPLVRLLRKRLEQIKQARVIDLRDYTLFHTVFRPEHVIKALKPLVDSEFLEVDTGNKQIRISSNVRVKS